MRDRAEMARLAAGLYRSPRRLLRATFTAPSGHEPTTEGLLLPLKMMHVDDTVALVTIDHTGAHGALHIESPALLKLLAEWFDAMWTARTRPPSGVRCRTS